MQQTGHPRGSRHQPHPAKPWHASPRWWRLGQPCLNPGVEFPFRNPTPHQSLPLKRHAVLMQLKRLSHPLGRAAGGRLGEQVGETGGHAPSLSRDTASEHRTHPTLPRDRRQRTRRALAPAPRPTRRPVPRPPRRGNHAQHPPIPPLPRPLSTSASPLPRAPHPARATLLSAKPPTARHHQESHHGHAVPSPSSAAQDPRRRR